MSTSAQAEEREDDDSDPEDNQILNVRGEDDAVP